MQRNYYGFFFVTDIVCNQKKRFRSERAKNQETKELE
jgi:hypothetical protein